MHHFKRIALASKILLIGVSSVCMIAAKDVEKTRIYSILETEGPRLSFAAKLEITDCVADLARTYQIDPMLILAVMKVESTFNPKAVSNARAYGLMQVRSIVVREVADELAINPRDHQKLLTSHDFNIRVGVHYLSNLIRKFGGDVKKALMAYNRGPTAVARTYRNRPVPSGGYQGKVLRAYRSYSARSI
jgi:soluble lytic murein transglycosylase